MNTKNTIRINDDSVDLSVSVFLFREDETYIAYCPSLDISGYDKTEEGAKADLEYMLKSWAKEQLTNGTIREDLEVNNWKASKNSVSPSNDPWFDDARNITMVQEGIEQLKAGGGKIYTAAELKSRFGL